MRKRGKEVIMIGHAEHPEVEGTMGQVSEGIYLVETEADVARLQVVNEAALAYVTQTTLSVDDAARIITALRARFPLIVGPKRDDICYATQNRQDAVKFMAPKCDIVIVVGSPNSSNSNRLREVAENLGAQSYLVDAAEQIQPQWLAGKKRIGVSSGASAPEVLVAQVIAKLRTLGAKSVAELPGIEETIEFPIPKSLAS
jgi:4-hydroxy-3-methylbut-2-enyl diphosphate reductase